MQLFFEQLLNGIAMGSIYSLITLGLALVYGILRILQVAHAGVYTVGAYVGLFAYQFTGSLLNHRPTRKAEDLRHLCQPRWAERFRVPAFDHHQGSGDSRQIFRLQQKRQRFGGRLPTGTNIRGDERTTTGMITHNHTMTAPATQNDALQ